jgi:hypothetical protein
MRNAFQGPGFLGNTSIAPTDWYSSMVPTALAESDIPEETKPLFRAGPWHEDAMQLKIRGMIKPDISVRILMSAMVFMINIFDLKIT